MRLFLYLYIMNKLVFIVLLLIGFQIKAQNLVPNPSFESYSVCPDLLNMGQIELASPWYSVFNNSIEYYNSCDTNNFFDVPTQCNNNFQYAYTGNAFIGLSAIYPFANNTHEYAQVQLLDTLHSSNCYYVEFFVNYSALGFFASNNLALSFSNTAVDTTGTGYILTLPSHIMKFGNPILTDTVNWENFSGIYTAIGGENYITIGNFNFDSNTDTLNLYYGSFHAAYYFIDDVSVIPIDSIPGGIPVVAGNDTTIIQGDSVFIGQEIYNLNCTWTDEWGSNLATGTSGLYVSPDSTTSYYVEQELCGNFSYDTVTVTVIPNGIGIHHLPQLSFEVYPNPNKGSFKINLPKQGTYSMVLMNTLGEVVYQGELKGKEGDVSVLLPNGIYILKLTDEGTGVMGYGRLVVE